MNYKMLSIITALLALSCETYSKNDIVTVQMIEDPIMVTSNMLGIIDYKFADSECMLLPGYIDSSDSLIYIGLSGDSSSAGVSAYSWEGNTKWSVDYGNYGYAAGVCYYADSVFFSVLEEMPVLDATTGEYLSSISVEGVSDSLMLPEAPDDYLPAIKATQAMEINSDVLLWTLPEFCQRASYCGFITDKEFSYQRNLRIYRIENMWYIGFTEGHFQRLSLYEIPSDNYTQRPNICNIALTDSSIIAILSYRDLVMEFDYNGRHIRSTYFGHQLNGASQFTCLFPVSSSARCLLADLDIDEIGNIYLLYSGYGTNQDGKAEIWRVNTVTGEARMTQLNHSASAFTVCGDRVAVVEQTHEPGEGDEVILLGTPSIHLYQIDWDL